jgi:hypothetical protein
MKNLSLLLAFVLLHLVAHGQDAVVSAVNMNVLYRGIPNPIEIAVPGITSDRINITSNDGMINRTDKGWVINPGGKNECVISVFADKKKVADKIFRVKPISKPIVLLAGIANGAISKEKAIKNGILEVMQPDFVWDIQYTIVGFSMLTSTEKGDTRRLTKGNTLTDEMKSQISELTRGQMVTFTDIEAMGPSGTIVQLNPIVLQIE